MFQNFLRGTPGLSSASGRRNLPSVIVKKRAVLSGAAQSAAQSKDLPLLSVYPR